MRQIGSKVLLHRLEGIWRVSRSIKDLQTGSNYQAEGTCSWAPAAFKHKQSLRYEEKMKPMACQQVDSYQCYYYAREEKEEHCLYKYFQDGRLFEKIDLTHSPANAQHVCVRDKYRGKYDFGGIFHQPSSFSITYSVNGPMKNYEAFSLYLRLHLNNRD